MSFFTKERMEMWKQQARDIKSSYNEKKGQYEEAKEKYRSIKNYQTQKKVKFDGKALQTVGVIPKGGEITIRLNPDIEILSIQYGKDFNVKLPYARVLGFRLECVIEEMENNMGDITSLVLSSGLLGRGTVGKASKIAGNMMKGMKKRRAIWVGTLVYTDKLGVTQELSFAGRDNELGHGDEPYKDSEDEEFERIVNGIAMKMNQDIMEL